MPEPRWKRYERRIAKWFGGKRRGAHTSETRQGKCDIVCETWAPECTLQLRGSIGYKELLKKCRQAEANAEGELVPVVVAKLVNMADKDSLVVMRGEIFLDRILNGALGDLGDEF
jgi:hypothetical protein